MFQNNISKRRNKTGCFCCRKRKIKCDEEKPSCYNCVRSSYKCVWPSNDRETLPHANEFKLEKLDKLQVRFAKRRNLIPSKVLTVVSKRSKRLTKEVEFQFDSSKEHKVMEIPLKTTNINTRNQYHNFNLVSFASAGTDKQISNLDSVSGLESSSSSLTQTTKSTSNESNSEETQVLTLRELVERRSPVIEYDEEDQALDDALFREYLEEQTKNYRVSHLLNGYSTWILGVDMTEEDAFFYDIFVKGFMIAVSPQFAHQDLQPGAIFIPPGTKNPILRSVFYACGAAFMCWKRDEMKRLAEVKYQECLDRLCDFIENESISGNEHWLLVAVLCLCLREKYHGEDITKHIVHVTTALQIIRSWQANKLRSTGIGAKRILSIDEYGRTHIDSCEQPLDPELDDSTSIHELFQREKQAIPDDRDEKEEYSKTILEERRKNAVVFNKFFERIGPTSEYFDSSSSANSADDEPPLSTAVIGDISSMFEEGYIIDACERTLLESFLYNYTISLLVCDKGVVKYLTSPFQVFKEFKPFLCQQLYHCPAHWMNNPVMGAALPGFELAAKTNWLALQYPFNEENEKIARKLLKAALYYTSPILSTDAKTSQPAHVQKKLMESCYQGNIVARSSYLFLLKMLYPEKQADEPEIQEIVRLIFNDVNRISIHSQEAVICTWPFAVFGTVVIDKKQRELVLWRIKEFSEIIQMSCFVTVANFLKLVWGTNEKPGVGWDALLDRECLKHLFV